MRERSSKDEGIGKEYINENINETCELSNR